MKIFGASLTDAADTYLHAGYISAAPQPTDILGEYPTLWDTANTGYAVSVESALRLADSSAGEAMTVAAAGGPGIGSWAALLGVAAAGAVGWSLADRWTPDGWRPAVVRAAVGPPALLAVLLAGACLAPWHDLDPRDYADPEAATKVILGAVVRDALMVKGQSGPLPTGLAGLQDHVALPGALESDGVAYALQSYGWDGWARDIEYDRGSTTTLTSAGADGETGTADDLSYEFEATDVYMANRAYYLVRTDGDIWITIRLEPDREANTSDTWGSSALAGGSESKGGGAAEFDAVPLTVEVLEEYFGEWGEEDHDAEALVAEITALYETHATQDDPDPVVVQLFAEIFAS